MDNFCTWGTVEVIVHLDEFVNLELLKKGLYKIEASVRLPSWTQADTAQYFESGYRGKGSGRPSSSASATGTKRGEGTQEANGVPSRRNRSYSMQSQSSGASVSGISTETGNRLKHEQVQQESRQQRTRSQDINGADKAHEPRCTTTESPENGTATSGFDKSTFARQLPADRSQLSSVIASQVNQEFYPYLGTRPSEEARYAPGLSPIPGTCYSSFSAPDRCMSVAPGSGLIANSDVITPSGGISDDGHSYKTRIVHIRYNDESFLMNEGAIFRIDAPMWRLRLQPVEVVIRLLFADAEAGQTTGDENLTNDATDVREVYVHPDGDFKVVRKTKFSLASTRIIRISGLLEGVGSWHQATPIVFGINYLATVGCLVHAAMTNIKNPPLPAPAKERPAASIDSYPQQHGDILNDLHSRFVGPLFHNLVELKVIRKLAEMFRKTKHVRRPHQPDTTEECLQAVYYIFHRYPLNATWNFTHISKEFRTEILRNIPQTFYGPSGSEITDVSFRNSFMSTVSHSPLSLFDGFGLSHVNNAQLKSFSGRCSNALVSKRATLRALSFEAHHLANHIFDVWIEICQLIPKIGRCFIPLLTGVWWKTVKTRLFNHAKKKLEWVGQIPPPSSYITQIDDSMLPIEVLEARLNRLLRMCTPEENQENRNLLCNFEFTKGFDPPYGGPLQHEVSLVANYMVQTILKLSALYQSTAQDDRQKALSKTTLDLVFNSLSSSYTDKMRKADAHKVATEGKRMISHHLPSMFPMDTTFERVIPLGITTESLKKNTVSSTASTSIGTYPALEWDLEGPQAKFSGGYFGSEASCIESEVISVEESDIPPKWLCQYHYYEEAGTNSYGREFGETYFQSDIPYTERDCSHKENDRPIDVLVFQHGLQGAVSDLRALRGFIKAYYMYGHKSAHFAPLGVPASVFYDSESCGSKFGTSGFSSVGRYSSPWEYEQALQSEFPPVRLLTCSPKSNQGEASAESLLVTSSRFAKEVDEFIQTRVVDQGYNLRRLCFIGFSLGGLIVRLGLRHPRLMRYSSHYYSLVTIASPHMGVTHDTSALFDTGVYLLRKIGRSKVMDELSLQDDPKITNSLLYAMCVGWNSEIKEHVSPRVCENINIIMDAINRVLEEERENQKAKRVGNGGNELQYREHHEHLALTVIHMCIHYLKYKTISGHPYMWDDALHLVGTRMRDKRRSKKKKKQKKKKAQAELVQGSRFSEKPSGSGHVQVENVLNALYRGSASPADAFSDDESSEVSSEADTSTVDDTLSEQSSSRTGSRSLAASQRSSSPQARTSERSIGSSVSTTQQLPFVQEEQKAFLNPFSLHSGATSTQTPDDTSACMETLRKEGFWNGAEGCLLRQFEHVWVIGSEQDKYSPFYSCLATLPELSYEHPGRCETLARMLEGFWHGVDMRRVCRFSAEFELSNRVSVNSMLGREAHLQYCENEKAAHWLAVMIGKMLYD